MLAVSLRSLSKHGTQAAGKRARRPKGGSYERPKQATSGGERDSRSAGGWRRGALKYRKAVAREISCIAATQSTQPVQPCHFHMNPNAVAPNEPPR
jgi:hypothetical protein